MYSDKQHINILTALLAAHGVRHAVVCPGSRNAPVVHNLNECPAITCHPVTDERSAAFYALGMTQRLQQPVVVCVTSGTALLGVLPAVAEAYYQHRPLVVVSADRPPQWIDQQDGQTLPQPDALGRFVCKAVTISEPHDEEQQWHCNRLVNDALLCKDGPVHINVAISEPLFHFTTPELPRERVISRQAADVSQHTLRHITHMFLQARRPMLISGQPMNPNMDEAVMLVADDERYVPDFVLYTGGAIVSKRLKRFLRNARETWVVNTAGTVVDTFMNLSNVIQGDGEMVADYVRFALEQQPHPFVTLWQELLERIRRQTAAYEPPFSQMAVVKRFEQQVGDAPVHYANSSAIRLANIYRRQPVWCNRGVNGIEGSLSTAAGYALVSDEPVFCVIGDLSFFYDQNALWNQELRSPQGGRLRILLLNNGGGGIFRMLPGLEQSPASHSLVAAAHTTTAEGICLQNDVYYQQAAGSDELDAGLDLLLHADLSRPMVLEVFTDAETDAQAMRQYHASLHKD